MKLKNHKPSKKTQSLDNNLVDKKTIPRHIKKLNNLTAYSIGKKAPKKVEFNKETVFESTGNVFINGYIGNIAIDERDNVFIVGEKPGIVNIYVFGPDGSYKAKFVKEGRGPGEFESIGSLKIKNNKIYIFGPRLQKVGIFSLKDHSLINDYKIGRDIFEHDSASVYKVTDIKTVYSDGTMLARFENNNMQDPNNNRQIFYYKLSPKAIIQEGIILEQKNTFRYKPETRLTSNGYYRLPRTMPFSVSSLLVASNGKIYAAQTNEFLIMVYDKSGTYQRAFYYPYKKSNLSISDVGLGSSRMQLINENKEEIPKMWPALHNMVIDDQERLWILTITDSDSTYKGWVLNKKGELMAKFNWSGSRNERTPEVSPLFKIKNGYLYTRERDIRKGIDRIVKYKIIFKEQ